MKQRKPRKLINKKVKRKLKDFKYRQKFVSKIKKFNKTKMKFKSFKPLKDEGDNLEH